MTAAATTCISVSTPTPVKVAPGKAPAAPSLRSHTSGRDNSSRTPTAIQRKRTSGRSARQAGGDPSDSPVMALGEVVIVQGSRITGEVLDLYLGSVAS